MILIVGKYEPLAKCVAEKFQAMHYMGDVQVRNATRLLDFIDMHKSDIDMLVYADKPQTDSMESSTRLEHLQLLWTLTAKHDIPLFLLFFKYKTNYVIDTQLDIFVVWLRKQFRKPPFHYVLKLAEVYGLSDRASAVDDFYRQITSTGSMQIVRWGRGEEEKVERRLDYVYAKDVARVVYWFATHRPENGVYEVGCGFPRTDTAVANAIFRTLKRSSHILYVDKSSDDIGHLPPAQAMNMADLRRIGYKKPFYSIETGVKSYIQRSILKE